MKEMLTSAEVAKVLRLNRRSIENRIRAGVIPGFGIPMGAGRKRWLVDRKDLEAYLEKQATVTEESGRGVQASA